MPGPITSAASWGAIELLRERTATPIIDVTRVTADDRSDTVLGVYRDNLQPYATEVEAADPD